MEFSYQIIDIRSFSADNLLKSDLLVDNLIAILCQPSNARETIFLILKKIAFLPRRDREDALAKLFVLSGLRGFEPLILQELRLMSSSFDIRDNTFLFGIFQQGQQEGHKEGRQEGHQLGLQQEAAKILERLLERKFGLLSKAVIDKVESAEVSTLELWAVKIFDINSLDEFLAL